MPSATKKKGSPASSNSESKKARFRTEKHQGKEILIVDISNTERDPAKTLITKLWEHLEAQKPKSVRLLVNIEKAFYDPARSNEWKRNMDLINAKLFRGAVMGLSPLQRIGLQGFYLYAKLSGRELVENKAFSNAQEAMDYLAQD